MCEALDKIEEIGVKKGILIGREEGREEGRILGVEQGEDLVSRLNGILAREGNIGSTEKNCCESIILYNCLDFIEV